MINSDVSIGSGDLFNDDYLSEFFENRLSLIFLPINLTGRDLLILHELDKYFIFFTTKNLAIISQVKFMLTIINKNFILDNYKGLEYLKGIIFCEG